MTRKRFTDKKTVVKSSIIQELMQTSTKIVKKFQGRCRFCLYMSSKSERYYIKYQILADADNHHCYNAISYLSKEGNVPTVILDLKLLRNLSKPLEAAVVILILVGILPVLLCFEELYLENNFLLNSSQNNPDLKLVLMYSLSRMI